MSINKELYQPPSIEGSIYNDKLVIKKENLTLFQNSKYWKNKKEQILIVNTMDANLSNDNLIVIKISNLTEVNKIILDGNEFYTFGIEWYTSYSSFLSLSKQDKFILKNKSDLVSKYYWRDSFKLQKQVDEFIIDISLMPDKCFSIEIKHPKKKIYSLEVIKILDIIATSLTFFFEDTINTIQYNENIIVIPKNTNKFNIKLAQFSKDTQEGSIDIYSFMNKFDFNFFYEIYNNVFELLTSKNFEKRIVYSNFLIEKIYWYNKKFIYDRNAIFADKLSDIFEEIGKSIFENSEQIRKIKLSFLRIRNVVIHQNISNSHSFSYNNLNNEPFYKLLMKEQTMKVGLNLHFINSLLENIIEKILNLIAMKLNDEYIDLICTNIFKMNKIYLTAKRLNYYREISEELAENICMKSMSNSIFLCDCYKFDYDKEDIETYFENNDIIIIVGNHTMNCYSRPENKEELTIQNNKLYKNIVEYVIDVNNMNENI